VGKVVMYGSVSVDGFVADVNVAHRSCASATAASTW